MPHGQISHECFKVFGTKFPKNNFKIIKNKNLGTLKV
jgi:hypothetical protein